LIYYFEPCYNVTKSQSVSMFLGQLCPTCGSHAAQSKVLSGPVW